jgi:predicted component of type VI protein secretion system
MPYQLVVTKGRSANPALKIPADGVTTVGRQQGCQIRIGSSQVSRKHCELFEKKGLLLVKDLNSSNGTFVNGKKVEGQQVLEAGNILTVGGVSFRVEPAAAEAAVPAGAKAGDTAVSRAVALGGEEDIDFEIVAEDEATITAAPPGPKSAQPAPSAESPTGQPEESPAAASEGGTDDFIVPAGTEAGPEINEDAVADYLLNIDLDDEDKV